MSFGHALTALLLALLLSLGRVDAGGFWRQPPSQWLIPHTRRLLDEASSSGEPDWTQLRPQKDKWDPKKGNRQTQASSYTSSKGQDPTGPGDAFTYFFAEASATTRTNGIYYRRDDENPDAPLPAAVMAGDMAAGPWSGTWAKNSAGLATQSGTVSAIAANTQPEFSTNRGTQAQAVTYCNARAAAGSSSFFNAATKDNSVHWGLQALSWNIDAYGPTPGDKVSVRNSRYRQKDQGDMARGYDTRRSVAFTDIPPNSAAQSLTGNGPAAIANGWEVAAASRAGRDKNEEKFKGTIFNREEGEDSLWKKVLSMQSSSGRRHRMILQSLYKEIIDDKDSKPPPRWHDFGPAGCK